MSSTNDNYICEIVDNSSRKMNFKNVDEQIRLELKVNRWYDDYGLSRKQAEIIGDYLYYSNRNIYQAPTQPIILMVTSNEFDALVKIQVDHLLTPFEELQKDIFEYKKKFVKIY